MSCSSPSCQTESILASSSTDLQAAHSIRPFTLPCGSGNISDSTLVPSSKRRALGVGDEEDHWYSKSHKRRRYHILVEDLPQLLLPCPHLPLLCLSGLLSPSCLQGKNSRPLLARIVITETGSTSPRAGSLVVPTLITFTSWLFICPRIAPSYSKIQHIKPTSCTPSTLLPLFHHHQHILHQKIITFSTDTTPLRSIASSYHFRHCCRFVSCNL